jgi:hypothetical protein
VCDQLPPILLRLEHVDEPGAFGATALEQLILSYPGTPSKTGFVQGTDNPGLRCPECETPAQKIDMGVVGVMREAFAPESHVRLHHLDLVCVLEAIPLLASNQ